MPAFLRFRAASFLCYLSFILLWAAPAHAQLQQPFVYTTGGGIATRNDTTGALTPTAASPLPVLGFPVVIDAKGRFLFAAGNDSIHMYQVDALTGVYTEVGRFALCFGEYQWPDLDRHRANGHIPRGGKRNGAESRGKQRRIISN
jgi:hypothetical protein